MYCHYIVSGYSHFAFSEKLSIWHPIIKGLGPRGFGRYSDAMHLLVSGILLKIQMRHDPELNDIDNETLDDDVRLSFFFFFFYRIYDFNKINFIFLDANRLATVLNTMY